MKKKLSIVIAALVLAAAIVFVPSVQAFAVSTLSIFRVDETKTIKITLADIEEMMDYFKQYEGNFEERRQTLEQYKAEHPDLAAQHADFNPDMAQAYKPAYKELDNVREFRDFSFHLPKVLEGEQPELYALEAAAHSFTLDAAKINAHLTEMGLVSLLDEKYNGTEITVNLPSAITARYNDVLLLATQGVAVDAPEEVLNDLWANVLHLPFIPENVRTQLAAIDLRSRDVYLPVILGVGRETAIGNSAAYIYSTKDLEQLASVVPAEMTSGRHDGLAAEEFPKQSEGQEASVLIWTKNGVLYVLGGPKTDSELIEIAGSIR